MSWPVVTVVESVRVVVRAAPLPEAVSVVGVKEHEAPLGTPVQLKEVKVPV